MPREVMLGGMSGMDRELPSVEERNLPDIADRELPEPV